MKRVFTWLFLLAFLMTLPQFATSASAKKKKWVPVSVVKDGVINTDNWQVDDSSAIITADGDRAKFEHLTNNPNDSAWLQFINCPERVYGLCATVEVGADVASQMRGRIGLEYGVYGPEEDELWAQLVARKRAPENGGDSVFGNLSALDYFDNYNWLNDLNYTQFGHPLEVAGETFRLCMTLDKKRKIIIFSVDGYGQTTYQLPNNAKLPRELFWGIGTRSDDNSGSGPVYFSDVEVLISGKCDKKTPVVVKTYPANNQKNVGVNLDQVWVKFAEAMQNRYSWEPPFDCTNENQTEFQYPNQFVCTNAGETLDYNTWYQVCLEQDGFFDLAGNGNKPSCFKFKTQPEPVAFE
jgi:hypothetical protein